MRLPLLLAPLVLISNIAAAQDCTSFLPTTGDITTLELVSLNKNGVSSYVTSPMAIVPGSTVHGAPLLVTRAGDTELRIAKQEFSDRSGPSHVQPFAIQTPDNVTVTISLDASPEVNITLLTWGNAKATFRVTCSTSGVMHGSTGDNEYLLFLRRNHPG